MGWETRKGKGRYYTRSRRSGGRVVREYVGSGPYAELEAELDGLDRLRRKAELEERQKQRATAEAVTVALAKMGVLTQAMMASTLERTGYHQHKGQWRRRRQ